MRGCRELCSSRGFHFKYIELAVVIGCKLNGMRGSKAITDKSHLSNAGRYQEHEYFALTSATGALVFLAVFIIAYIVDETNHYILESLFLTVYAFHLAVAGAFLVIEAEYTRTLAGGIASISAALLMAADCWLLLRKHRQARRDSE